MESTGSVVVVIVVIFGVVVVVVADTVVIIVIAVNYFNTIVTSALKAVVVFIFIFDVHTAKDVAVIICYSIESVFIILCSFLSLMTVY